MNKPIADANPYDLAPVPAEPVVTAGDSSVIHYASKPVPRKRAMEHVAASSWRDYYLPGLIAFVGANLTLLAHGLAIGPYVLASWVGLSAIVLLAGRRLELDLGVLPSSAIRILAFGCALSGAAGLAVLSGYAGVLLYIPIFLAVIWMSMRALFDAEVRTAALCAAILFVPGTILWLAIRFCIH